MSKDKTPIIPTNREALKNFRAEYAEEINPIKNSQEYYEHTKGASPLKLKGAHGGPIGGRSTTENMKK